MKLGNGCAFHLGSSLAHPQITSRHAVRTLRQPVESPTSWEAGCQKETTRASLEADSSALSGLEITIAL